MIARVSVEAVSWLDIYTQVFNCQEVDHRLALALFINRPKNEALKMMMSLIKSSGHKYKKLQVSITYRIICILRHTLSSMGIAPVNKTSMYMHL